jgi:hypothetical protein
LYNLYTADSLDKDFASEYTGRGSRASKIDVTKSLHRQIVKSKLPPCSLLPAEVAVPSTRQVYSTNPGYPSTTALHKQLDLEESFHIYSFDFPYPSTNISPS